MSTYVPVATLQSLAQANITYMLYNIHVHVHVY